MSFWSKMKSFFGYVEKEAVTHPQAVAAIAKAVVTKNPAPLIAGAEQIIDDKTKQ